MKRSAVVIAVISGIVLVSMIAIIAIVVMDQRSITVGGADTVAFIPLSGSIAEGSEPSIFGAAPGITPDFVRHQLEEAEDDPAVGAVILKIDSPGGAVGASQEIAEFIRDAEKPVVVFTGDMVASGGYYIASQADKIVAKPGSLVGSIGVISQIPDLSGLYEKLGIKMQTIKSGKNKDMFQRELTAEERTKFQRLSDELYEQFIADVAKGRKISKDKVRSFATGEVFAATDAKKLGLVDTIGGYQTAIDTAAKLADIEDPYVEEYRPPTIFDELFGVPGFHIRNLLRLHALGRDVALLEQINNMYAAPQFRYYGGQ